LLSLARELDQNSNFDSFWIADSLVANGPPDEPKLEAWTALAAIAQATTRLRLGLLVAGNVYRHPVLTAKIVTTLDHISNGRIELGIGAGWPDPKRSFGIDFGTRAERLERFSEALEVIKQLWTIPNPTFEGRYYQLNEPPYSPPNIQRPHPPILVGAGSDRVLRIAARYADKIHSMVSVEQAREKVEGYCREIGRRPDEVRWAGGGWLFLNDDRDIQRRALEAAMQQYGESEETIRGAGLFGSLEEVRAGVRRQIDHGVDEVIVFQLPRIHRASLFRFSDEVIPGFGKGLSGRRVPRCLLPTSNANIRKTLRRAGRYQGRRASARLSQQPTPLLVSSWLIPCRQPCRPSLAKAAGAVIPSANAPTSKAQMKRLNRLISSPPSEMNCANASSTVSQ
jgi:alkanesulfonate monooxygenase SsuD/methylene tetrahydromethanopterin reductase-like flavin-dependent oxidoreductase (luciferase family)